MHAVQSIVEHLHRTDPASPSQRVAETFCIAVRNIRTPSRTSSLFS